MKAPVHDPSWSDEVQRLFEHDMQEIWDPTINRSVWFQYHNQLSVYEAFASQPAMRILDVGCAQGTLALRLAEQGHDVLAVDLRKEFLDYAARRYTHGRIRFRCHNVLEMKMDERFDLIFANQIVEHLVYPQVMINRLRDLLLPGGRLVVTTPNGNYVKNDLPSFRELGEVETYQDRQFTADGDGHFFAYLDEELREFFELSGLSEVEARHFETPFVSGHMKFRHVHRYMPNGFATYLDRLTLSLPFVSKILSHQLLVTGVQS